MTVTKEHIRQPNCSFSAQIYPCALPPKWWLCFYALQVSSPSCCYTSLLSCRIPMLMAWALDRSGRSQDYLWNGTMKLALDLCLLAISRWIWPKPESQRNWTALSKSFFPPCVSHIFHINQKHTTFTYTVCHRQGFVEENLQSLVPALDNANEVNGKKQWRLLWNP